MTEVYRLAVILIICVIGGIADQFLSPDLFLTLTMPKHFVTIEGEPHNVDPILMMTHPQGEPMAIDL